MMKKLFLALVFITSITQAQYTVKGTMTPPEKSDWVMLQKLEGAKQKFLKHTTIKVDTVNIGGQEQSIGRFEIEIPKDAKPGMYRVTYRNKGAGFIDFLFNNENVEMVFNPQYPDQSVFFTSSLENKLYNEYQDALALTQRSLDSVQIVFLKDKNKSSKKAYKRNLKKLKEVQEIYENKSKGMLVHNFIKASKNYNSSEIKEDLQDYLNGSVENFFNNIDFNDDKLYNSSFLINKVVDYIFFLNEGETQALQQKMYKESIAKVLKKVDSNKDFKNQVIEYLITNFTDKRNSEIVDWLFATYYDKLPADAKKTDFKKKKLEALSVSVGRIAPDFSWKEENKDYKLSALNDAEQYLMVFWSTRCSHCVEEIPEVYDFMKNHKNTSVVAIAIENDELDFNEFIKKLYGWHNVLATHPESRFENKIVKDYLIDATPTYFVLDKNKKIVAIPNVAKDVKDYFNSLKK